jgi:ferredoxin-like protein FixX
VEEVMVAKCPHGEVEFLGEQRGERGSNKYYRCLKCGAVLVLSEEGILYEIPKGGEKKTESKT